METFLRRHGGKTIIVGRFIGLVRALAPFAAGSMNMPARRLVPAVFLAAGVWSATFTALGYAFWQSFDQAEALAKQGTFALVAVLIAVAVLVISYRNLRNPERRRQLRRRIRTLAFIKDFRTARHPRGMNRLSLTASRHCLTGCADEEVVGLVVGAAAGLSNRSTPSSTDATTE